MIFHSLEGKQDFEITAALFIDIHLKGNLGEFFHSIHCVKTKYCYCRTNDILACRSVARMAGNLKSADFLIFAINPCLDHD